jgi:hypothetical protein
MNFPSSFSFQYFAKTSLYFLLHLLTWDYSDTKPEEEFNSITLVNFFTDPDIIASNVYVVIGTVIKGILKQSVVLPFIWIDRWTK